MTINALKILSNNDTLEKFKSNALNQAKKFDIKIILPRYENLYRDCVDYFLNNWIQNSSSTMFGSLTPSM